MVQKLKPLKKVEPKPAFRVCVCGVCKWLLAAPSLAKLLAPAEEGGAGWSSAAEGEVWAFVCHTCALKHAPLMQKMPHAQAFFDSLPAAPANPVPCLGVPGHETSRPEEENVRKETETLQ